MRVDILGEWRWERFRLSCCGIGPVNTADPIVRHFLICVTGHSTDPSFTRRSIEIASWGR